MEIDYDAPDYLEQMVRRSLLSLKKPYRVDDVARVAREFYSVGNNGAGGWLHIVLDDDNLEDPYLQYCIDLAGLHNDRLAVDLGHVLLAMSVLKRAAVRRRVHAREWNG